MSAPRHESAQARQRRERALRLAGYRGGLNGRPAWSSDAAYQASWRRGQEERRRLYGGES